MARAEAQAAALLRNHKRMAERHAWEERDDQIDHLNGVIDEAELQRRRETRKSEEAKYGPDGPKTRRVVAAIREGAKRRKSRARSANFNSRYERLPMMSRDDYLTEAEQNVLFCMMECGQGKASLEMANGYVTVRTGLSRTTVQNATRKLENLGYVRKVTRQVPGKAMNRPNLYVVVREELKAYFAAYRDNPRARWNRGKGGQAEGAHLRNIIPSSTDAPRETGGQDCREEAGRGGGEAEGEGVKDRVSEGGDVAEVIHHITDEEVCELTSAGLGFLGREAFDDMTPDKAAEQIEELMAEAMPALDRRYWRRGVQRHGLRRCLLAALETVMVARMRKNPKLVRVRPEENRLIRHPERYLSGILKAERGECRPEVTIGSIIEESRLAHLPESLKGVVEDRRQARERELEASR